ncbi:DNA methyltransferase [Erythrobacter donghaensis]|uniref:DNA methyltransferase n=1 Tax=Erythrobacter donghaensis TaxID=267135 RepID=UPI00130238CE|nr:DNA methyltransferase [Erythrobacter donghaensis]
MDVTDQEILRKLETTDWSFESRIIQHEVESVHPYPAKFISDLPAAILDALPSRPNTLLMDPFCGSGTTLAEGQRRGLQTIGVDLNPVACLIARVKTAPLPKSAAQSAAMVLDKLGNSAALVPLIPNLGHWFKGSVQAQLANLMQAISEAPAADQDFLKLAASSIIVRVSNQDSDTRYAAVDKPVTGSDVAKLFERACNKLYEALERRDYDLVNSRVIESDILSFDCEDLEKKVGIFITSPPYPNAYEYWLYHKYRMWWLGHDPLAVKQKEIGARAHFFKKNHHTADTFIEQMSAVFEIMNFVAAPKAWACFVVGRSKIHGLIVDNAKIIEDVAAQAGFEPFFRTERVVKSSRKSFNLSHANIKTETVLILRGAQ